MVEVMTEGKWVLNLDRQVISVPASGQTKLSEVRSTI